MIITQSSTYRGGIVTTCEYDSKVYRKYTHPCRNTQKRQKFDIRQVVNVALGYDNSNQVKVR